MVVFPRLGESWGRGGLRLRRERRGTVAWRQSESLSLFLVLAVGPVGVLGGEALAPLPSRPPPRDLVEPRIFSSSKSYN